MAEQLREIDSLGNIILEPVGRDTVPAIASAADHIIENETGGIAMEFKDEKGEWRFSHRSSNTEPVVRLNVESIGNIKLMNKRTEELLAILREKL